MSLSAYQIKLLVDEIKPLLFNGLIQKIWNEEPTTFLIKIRNQQQNFYLKLSLSSDSTALYLIPSKEVDSTQPSAFTMVLRKWCQGSRVIDMEVMNHDRIVKVHLQRLNQEKEEVFYLILELTGRHGNILLLNQDEMIINFLRLNRSQQRQLSTHQPYFLPPPPSATWQELAKKDQLNLLNLSTPMERSQRVQDYFKKKQLLSSCLNLRGKIFQSLKKQLHYVQRRTQAIERNLKRAEESQKYKQWGELLLAIKEQGKAGQSQIEVINYYQADLPTVIIPLDPILSLKSNIELYFKKYKKYKNAHSLIETQLMNGWENIIAIEEAIDLLQREYSRKILDNLSSFDDIVQFKQNLSHLHQQYSAQKLLFKPREQGVKKEKVKSLPYREYISITGHQIWVGKSSKHNDTLSLRIARGSDLWLHAQNWSGAHVILKLNKKELIQQESLLDAATLAAHFCESHESQIDIIYTYAKYLKKPKGSPPGTVYYSNIKCISITIEKERIMRLLFDQEIMSNTNKI